MGPPGDTRSNVTVAEDEDLIFTTVPPATPRINAAGEIRVESFTVPRVRVLAFNSGLPQFSNVRVRRAVSSPLFKEGFRAGWRPRTAASAEARPPEPGA